MMMTVSRRSALTLGAAALIAPPLQAASQPVLIELFTSQGCSSCPPADQLAGELAKDPNLIVVSLNVDYWDYLGWRDTLAKPEYTQRQYDYAAARGDARVYTPQIVVNGGAHVVGSDKAAVQSAIASASAPSIPLELTVSNKQINVALPEVRLEKEATLWLMATAPSIGQKIERGENAGKTITYYNVVRNIVPATMWDGKAYHGSWMKDAVMLPDCTACVAVLQTGKAGPLLGLARA